MKPLFGKNPGIKLEKGRRTGMIKLACMTLPYIREPFERALAGIAKAGYTYVAFGYPHAGVEVPNEEAEPEREAERLRSLLKTYGLEAVMLFGNIQLAPGQPFERSRNRLLMAKALGISEVLSVGISNYRKFPDDKASDGEMKPKYEAFVASWKRIAAEAEALGVTLTLKPHGGNTATAMELTETLRQIGSPSVRACYDPGNVAYYEGVSPEQDFPRILDQLHSLIAKDHRGAMAVADFPVPGTGDVDFGAMFAAMKRADLQGSVLVERVDGSPEPEAIDRRIAEARQRLGDLLSSAGLDWR
jgi:sugar phosphate isomerase/epimerase